MKNLQLSVQHSLKAVSQEGQIEGYASVFNGVDSAFDTILPSAYNNIISSKELPAMFFNHESFDLPVGRWEEMRVDEKGLYVKGSLNLELDSVTDLYKSIKFGSVTGLSVRILFTDEDFEEQDGCQIIKNVARVPEISIVSMPCDPSARITSVKDLEGIDNVRDFEKHLRDLGASQKEALTLISKAKKLFGSQSDFDEEKQSEIIKRINALSHIKLTGV